MPWHQPGFHIPQNAATTSYYRGINILALWAEACQRGYGSNLWASYKQWQDLGAQVRKGERGSVIVFYKKLEGSEESEKTEERSRFVARATRVFNVQQVDGYATPATRLATIFEASQEAEALVQATGAIVRHGYSMACYRAAADTIEMPDRAAFTGTSTSSSVESYYGVLLHELTHWTGALHRLARDLSQRFGAQAYAMEELVAELGVAFLCSDLGITAEPRPDHAAYIASWLKVLHQDSRAIFTAASKAQEAVQYLARSTLSNL